MKKDIFVLCAITVGLMGCKSLQHHSYDGTPSYGSCTGDTSDPLAETRQNNLYLEQQLIQKQREELRYQAAMQENRLASQRQQHALEQRRLQQEIRALEAETARQNRVLQARQELQQRQEREENARRISELERRRQELNRSASQSNRAPVQGPAPATILSQPHVPATQDHAITPAQGPIPSPTQPVVPANLPPAPTPQPAVQPVQATVPSQANPPAWEPNSGQLVQAGEVMMRLYRENGNVTPSRERVISGIRDQLHLSDAQASKVCENLMG